MTTMTPRGSRTSIERVGDLRRETLLHLRAAGEDVDEAGDLGQPRDVAVVASGCSRRVRRRERHQVVLAHRPHLDVLDQHQLVVADVERGREDLARVLVHAGQQLGVRLGDAARGVTQPVAVGVLADRDQQLADRRLGPGRSTAHGRSGVRGRRRRGRRRASPRHRGVRTGVGPMMWPVSGARPFVELTTGGTVDGTRVSEPVQAGRISRRRSGSKISATWPCRASPSPGAR